MLIVALYFILFRMGGIRTADTWIFHCFTLFMIPWYIFNENRHVLTFHSYKTVIIIKHGRYTHTRTYSTLYYWILISKATTSLSEANVVPYNDVDIKPRKLPRYFSHINKKASSHDFNVKLHRSMCIFLGEYHGAGCDTRLTWTLYQLAHRRQYSLQEALAGRHSKQISISDF